MSNALQGLLQAAAAIVSKLSPVAKTVVAAVLPLAAALLNMAIQGKFDLASVIVLATGVVTALAVFLVPNKTQAKAKAKKSARKR